MALDPAAWLQAYARAWKTADSNAVVELFTNDATYRSHIFRDPHVGSDGIRRYWDRATSTQSSVSVRIGDSIAQGDRAVAEWWTTMSDEGGDVTLPGALVLHFDGNRCDALREYWHTESGRLDPRPGWGEVDLAGSSGATGAKRWIEGWIQAWPAGDTDIVLGIVSENVEYRSHPFREPHIGRSEVRGYVEQAFDEESEVAPRFGAPIVAGSSAAVEYWATMLDDGQPATLAGCSILTFDAEGLASRVRDYWHMEEGSHAPAEFD